MFGSLYDQGEGVKEDDVEAVRWYLKAAKQGDQFAQYNLALMYDQGMGVEQDYVKAMHWYRQAAEQGDMEAQYSVGLLYQLGEGAKVDPVEAYAWFSVAHRHDDSPDRDRCVELEKQLTQKQLAKAKARVREIVERYGL